MVQTAVNKPVQPKRVRKSEGTLTIKIPKVDYVALMEAATTGKTPDRDAMQQVIDGLIKPLEVAGAPELIDSEAAESYIELDSQEREIKERKELLRPVIFREAAENAVVKFRISKDVSLLIVDSSSSRVDTSLLTPQEQMTYEALKSKATVKFPVLALKRSK